MFRLMHVPQIALIRRNRERGATATIIGILLAGGVVLGSAAISIDVGSMMWERRQVQNGADAAALALAKVCAEKPGSCSSGTMATFQGLINSNAGDGANAFDSTLYPNGACGRGVAGLPECADGVNDSLVACPALPDWLASTSLPYVEAHTQTSTASGTVLRPFIAQVFGFAGSTIATCARAAWGPLGTGTAIIPLTLSICEYNDATNFGKSFPKVETVFALNEDKDAKCSTWAGHDLPGGFGWLEHDSTCKALVDPGSWVKTQTGVGGGNDCGDEIEAMVGKVVYLPIFDCMDDAKQFCPNVIPNGTWSYYHIKGWAAFHISGIEITGQIKEFESGYPTKANEKACKVNVDGKKKCLFGWFLDDWVTSVGQIDPGGTDFGVSVIQAAG